MGDWIELVESAYNLDGNLESWLGHVLEAAESLLDQGGGLAGWVYSQSGNSSKILATAGRGPDPAFAELTRKALARMGEQNLQRLLRGPASAGTLTSVRREQRPVDRTAIRALSGDRFQDAFGLVAPTATGRGLVIGGPLPSRRRTSASEFARYSRVAAHLGAGLRLRFALEASASRDAEAVLDPDARVHDANGSACGTQVRDWLRAAVKNRERARTREHRADADLALSLWEGLVAGRWSLLDRFESDGKRFIVARPNDPELGDARGLSRRERQIAQYLGMKRSPSQIAYLLGLTTSAVSNAARRACAKLSLRGSLELANFFAPDGLRARLTEIDVDGETLAVGSTRLLNGDLMTALSDAERDIAEDLLRGSTNAAISERRGSSPNTVATQVKTIYEKLGVHSRLELAARLEHAGS